MRGHNICFLLRNKKNYLSIIFSTPFYLELWTRLFKTNDVVSQRFVKFSEVNFSDMPIFFVEKHVQKLLSFFQQKYHCVLLQSHKTLNELTS